MIINRRLTGTAGEGKKCAAAGGCPCNLMPFVVECLRSTADFVSVDLFCK